MIWTNIYISMICLDCDGNLVNWNTPSYHFTKGFQNNKGRDLVCDMGIDNGGWIVSITEGEHTNGFIFWR